MTAQCHDPTAGPADVAEQRLQDRGGADDLDAGGVVGPTNGVANGSRALTSGVRAHRRCDRSEGGLRHPTRGRHHLRGVAAEVPLEELEHTSRVGQGRIRRGPWRALSVRVLITAFVTVAAGTLARAAAHLPVARCTLLRCTVVRPRGGVVRLTLAVPAREVAVEVLGVHELVVDDCGCVAVGRNVLAELVTIGQHVVDQSAQERDVRAGADRHVHVSDRTGACEPGIDVDDLCTSALRLDHPLEAHGMVLRHVRPHDQDGVAVLQVLQERRGTTSSERCPQTGDRGRVSNAGLVLDLDRPPRREHLLPQVVLFVVQCRAAQ